MEYTLQQACLQVQDFHILADILKEEMKEQVFKGSSNFDTMKLKYEHLDELVNIIANETYVPVEEKNNDE